MAERGRRPAGGNPRGLDDVWLARIAAAIGEEERVVPILERGVQKGGARPGWVHVHPEWRYMKDRAALNRWLTPN